MNFWKQICNIRLDRKATAILLAFSILTGSGYSVYGSKIEEAQGKKENAENIKEQAQESLDEINGQIDSIHAAQNSLQREMEAYDTQLMGLLTDMELLDADIEEKQSEIEEADAALMTAKEEEKQQYEAMKTRIQYMYENSDGNMVAAMLGAESVTDLLNRVEYVSRVYDYDRDQLTAYQEIVQEVEDLTVQLANEMAEMEELQINYQEQAVALETLIDEKSRDIAAFDVQLSEAKALAGEYAQTIRKQNQIIAKQEEAIAAEIAAEEARKAAEEAAKKAAEEAAAATENAENSAGTEKGSETTENTVTDVADNSETSEEKPSETEENSGSNSESNNSETGTGNSGSSTGLTEEKLDPAYTTSVSGSEVVKYASQYVGNPYVFGGTSLTEGCDCSYFVMACFEKFGIYLPRSSYSMRSKGNPVSYNCAKAGDIICYPGHVAIYMGDGKIVHAASPSKGICYGNATYRTITTIRRVL